MTLREVVYQSKLLRVSGRLMQTVLPEEETI